MMRFGVGAHVMHGGHGSGGKATGEETSYVDPVCGMINYHWLFKSPITALQIDGP